MDSRKAFAYLGLSGKGQVDGDGLVSATQPVTDDPAGRLLQNILQSFGQFDDKQRAERSISGMRRQAEAGRFLNPAPLGYRNNGKANPSMLVDQASAPMVRGMYWVWNTLNSLTLQYVR
jgi:DNA invertase Pin-like site-specific DNA recombinase